MTKVMTYLTKVQNDNLVTNLEVVIDPVNNNVDYVNELLQDIINLGFKPIANEVSWGTTPEGDNVLRVFGATEGRLPANEQNLIKLVKELL